MSNLLTGITEQPGFPLEDVSDGNASMLEVMLANQREFTSIHEYAENTIRFYNIAHQALIYYLSNLLQEQEKVRLASIGIAVVETIGVLINYENQTRSN